MPFREELSIPKVLARHSWAASLKAGPDLEAILGITQATEDAAILSGLTEALTKMVEVGTAESVSLNQKSGIIKRWAFGPNPLQPKQTVVQGNDVSLKISRVVLKRLPEVEALFNFFPSDLALQTFPFIIELVDVGSRTPETERRHILFGCRFSTSSVTYSVDKQDNGLVQSMDVECGRMLTIDPSVSGNAMVQLVSGVSGQLLASSDSVQNLISDLNI